MKNLLKKIQFKYFCLYAQIKDWQHCYIHKIHDCDNCKHFGGLMCDHVDENWNCLGWEPMKWQPIKHIKQRYYMKKMIKKLIKIKGEYNDSKSKEKAY